MTSEANRRDAVLGVKRALRDVNSQIALLSHRVSLKAGVSDLDLDTLDFVSRRGPLSASAIARGFGVHPATLTGVLDRLERGGWITRERDDADRRAVVVRIDPKREADVAALYQGMNSAMEGALEGFDEEQLATITAFLERTAEAGRVATGELEE